MRYLCNPALSVVPFILKMDVCRKTPWKKIKASKGWNHLNRLFILELLQQAREEVLKNENTRLDFDDPKSLSDTDYLSLTGFTRDQLNDVMTIVKNIRPTKTKSIRTCVAILLIKLRSEMDKEMLGTVFKMKKFQESPKKKSQLISFHVMICAHDTK